MENKNTDARLTLEELFKVADWYVGLGEKIADSDHNTMYNALAANEMVFDSHPDEFEEKDFTEDLMNIYPTLQDRSCLETLRQLRLCHVIDRVMFDTSGKNNVAHYEKELVEALYAEDRTMREANRKLFGFVVSDAFIDGKLHENYNRIFPHNSAEERYDAPSRTVQAYMQDNSTNLNEAYSNALDMNVGNEHPIDNSKAQLDAYGLVNGREDVQVSEEDKKGPVVVTQMRENGGYQEPEDKRPVYTTKIVGLKVLKQNN